MIAAVGWLSHGATRRHIDFVRCLAHGCSERALPPYCVGFWHLQALEGASEVQGRSLEGRRPQVELLDDPVGAGNQGRRHRGS